VGVPVGPRRRTPGLRREEVAVLAGLSPTWYTYLEQGRKIRPSAEVLDSLAGVLGLTEEERRYMHLLAHGHEPVGHSSLLYPPDLALFREIVTVASKDDNPVYAANRFGDMLAWNDATTVWYTDFGALPENRRNMLWWMLTDPVARERLVDWEQETEDLIARFRAATATFPHNERIRGMMRELEASSPDFRRWWGEHAVRERRTRVRRLRHPELGLREVRLVVLNPADDEFNAVLLHLPPAAQPTG
jgi:transcriptional regulator with XRE-family HTH domain